ncbi:ImmA/IrrE family metallo-endopeptidase [Amycolatopsis sp., V23-08]|uniref:ImmA/IrrE family metallo-endopeptidase n=1 Tax=Amycolatopsis heterodermiae TaxID=3110235 RepID=A0ABU5QZ25_9PSEU|nr:ImmA/IrrE family metallo-endopeptidase [Amycolatopsis sp., V23-08]MEA5358765.1 ImmA/IrrE family metallo-endopeptidase [Amycolatopsis sp., V23-08]
MAELLASLRSLAPKRPLSYGESLQLARMQANALREYLGATDQSDFGLAWLLKQQHVPVQFVPSIKLDPADCNGSGMTVQLSKGQVEIYLNEIEPAVRQRFSAIHEVKHVIDLENFEILTSNLGSGNPGRQHLQVELLCNEFAAHVLMPPALVARVWGTLRDLEATALMFNVSAEAMRTRLTRLGLINRPIKRTFLRTSGNISPNHCCA